MEVLAVEKIFPVQGIVERRQAREIDRGPIPHVERAVLPVALSEPSFARVPQDVGPDIFAFADHDRVGVLLAIVRAERHPGAAENRLDPAPTELLRDVEGAADLQTHGRDAHEIVVLLEIDVLSAHLLVEHLHFDAGRRDGLQVRQDRAARPRALALEERSVGIIVGSLEQQDLHRVFY